MLILIQYLPFSPNPYYISTSSYILPSSPISQCFHCKAYSFTLLPSSRLYFSNYPLLLKSSIFLHCCFHFPSLYRYMLVFFIWKKKKCFFHPTLPFSSYNNIFSHCSLLHAMAAWPLCAPLSLIRLAGSSSFLLLKLNSGSLPKTFYFFSPKVVPSVLNVPISSPFQSPPSSKWEFLFNSPFHIQSVSKASQLFIAVLCY